MDRLLPPMLIMLWPSMAPTVSTPSTVRIRSRTVSHMAHVSLWVASSGISMETDTCGLSISGIKAVPMLTASTALAISSATAPSRTGALCRSTRRSSFS